MIGKERLQELIEQNATIYSIDRGITVSIEFDTTYPIKIENNDLIVGHFIVDISNLYETLEQVEFVKKNWCSIIERFEPPLWEDIEKPHSKPYSYKFAVPNLYCRGTILVMNTNIVVTWGYTGYCEGHESFGEPTKENYIKACKLAKKLFLGEE